MAFLGITFGSLSRTRARSGLPPPKGRRAHFCLLLFVLTCGAFGPAQAQGTKEYQLKAAFLFNFTEFVKWPSTCFTSADAPFSIGVLGDDPFGSALEQTIRGEAIGNHKLQVVHGQTLADLKDCQLLFICKSETDHLGEILSELDSRPVLTVSDIDSFAQSGGTIDFYLQAGRVRFEINPDSARRRGLQISSQLLNLGRIVKGGD